MTSVSKGAVTYAGQVQYYPHGAPKQMTLGNGLVSKWDFNSRLQLTKTQLGSVSVANSVAEFGLSYSGITCAAGQNWANNGNVVKQDIVVGGVTFSQTYGYDRLNRLSCVKEGSLSTPTWNQEFQYDRYGNRWIPAGSNNLPYTESITATVAGDFDAGTNRLISAPTGGLANYDGTGNLKRLAGGAGVPGPTTHDLSYDGENRIYESIQFGVVTGYVYDGFGRRVKRSGMVPAYFVYDASGNLLMEESADVESSGVSYVTQDHLGSTRVVTDQGGNVVRRYDYAPFGEDLKLAGGRTTAQKFAGSEAELRDRVRFTGKERDAETGLDYFGARYLGAAQGRFTSPDVPLVDQRQDDPRSWNLYAYVRNSPLMHTDPTGRCSKANGGYTDKGSELFSGPCSGGQIGEDKAGNNSVTVGVGWDQARLIMLQGVGQQFTAHGVAKFVSDAAQSTGKLTGATDVAKCLTSWITGSGCDKTGATLAAIPFVGRPRAINLPGWAKLSVDWVHIAERHMPGGAFTEGRDVFMNLSKDGVLAAIEQAYGTAATVSVQGERALLEGVTKTGMTVQIWLNKVTNTIETAYPVGKQW